VIITFRKPQLAPEALEAAIKQAASATADLLNVEAWSAIDGMLSAAGVPRKGLCAAKDEAWFERRRLRLAAAKQDEMRRPDIEKT
jgi:hypothetical protein